MPGILLFHTINFTLAVQLVGGFNLGGLLDKPVSKVSFVLPPATFLHFVANETQHYHRSSIYNGFCQLALLRFGRQTNTKKK